MPTLPVEKSFCTTTEAARLLGISVATAQLWSETGLLSAWKTDGGHRRILRTSVDQHLYRHSAAAEHVAHVAPAALPAPASVDRPAQDAPLRVVVVEDDAALLRLYAVKLRAWPMQTELETFNNAFAALMRLGRHAPDLLVVDLNMPDLDGFAMLRMLRQAPETRATRIVVVSGLQASAIAVRGGLPEGIEVLPKPVPFDRLLTVAQETLQRRPPLSNPAP